MLAEIKRVLRPGGTVHVIGAASAVSVASVTALTAAGYVVVRYAGSDRYGTAAEVARTGLGRPSLVVLASGLDFPDALVAGPAAASVGAAVLLTVGEKGSAVTDAYLASVPQIRAASVGASAAHAYPWTFPLVGRDRYDTAVRVAREFFGPPREAFIATGTDFPDALSGGAAAALTGNPLLLTPATGLPLVVSQFLDAASAATSFDIAIGGPPVVSDAVLAEAVRLAGGAEPWVPRE